MVKINFHRTRLGASAAKRTGKGKMLPILETAQVWRDDRADGSGVRRAVGVAADIAENRANVQASAAANAVEGITLLGVREQLGAAIVQQDHMIFFGAIRL